MTMSNVNVCSDNKNDLSIDCLEISNFVKSLFRRIGIVKVSDISSKSSKELLKYRYFGKKHLDKVKSEISKIGFNLKDEVLEKHVDAKSSLRRSGGFSSSSIIKMARVKYIAVPCDEELYKAVEEAGKKSGLKLGPEAAMRLRRSLKVGQFAPKKEVA